MALVVFFFLGLWRFSRKREPQNQRRVVVNEASRTLLYLPLYVALDQHLFENDLKVEIVTGGTAASSFAAMMSGEAQFSQADPMYAAIGRAKGADAVVVANVVGRIGIWGVSHSDIRQELTPQLFRGKTIATHPRPMTAYTYTLHLLQSLDLVPEKDVIMQQSAPGSELAAFLTGKADFMFSVEPNVSNAEESGAHVFYSFPQEIGDRVLTGLMTRRDYLERNRDVVVSMVSSYQRALNLIHTNSAITLVTARKFFPQLPESVLRRSLKRLADERVFPLDISIGEESWNGAMQVRLTAGDIKSASGRAENCAIDLMTEVLRKTNAQH